MFKRALAVMMTSTAVILFSIFPVQAQQKGNEKDAVLAEVNGATVTQSQLDEKLNALPVQLQASFKGQKPLLLDDMVNQQLLLQEAKKRKLERDEKVQKAIGQLKQNVLIQRMLEVEVLEKAKVTPEEAKAYFEKNKAEFMSPATIHPWHILLPDEAKAKEAQKRLQKGEDFSKVAKEISICPSAPRGGDLGVVRKGQMVPEFEEAAFKLKLNEVSPIVKTQFGYHLIKVTEKEEPKEKAFDEVSQDVQTVLLEQKRRDLLQAYLKTLKDKGQVKVYPEKIK